ncbi:hypothetical protein B0G80_0296 [Paraburkholderia sp. BL6669N2]|uniref:hypothetical protein n=1 Tax=Paraburkholderia sp. BL6669N2 TaxID=1938807 RepID=UPI000E27895E|nr:hypothetical protein [Paraburkholderia sp. BL6669N2]REG57671.1 hypothetical protein B0G80_0296 [Paraburkholderia sp. BL6669N2]
MNARETADSGIGLHGDALQSTALQIHSDSATVNALSERVFKILVLVVCGWSLIEAPLELNGADAHAGLLALLLSKLLVVGTGLAAVAKARFARGTFAFLCGASVLAIAPALPMEFNHAFAIAIFSSIECFSKAACVLAFAVASSRDKLSRER